MYLLTNFLMYSHRNNHVYFQKIIIQKVIRTYLYMCYQYLPEEFADQDSVYFIRNIPGMVPLPNNKEEAKEMLPGYFETGLLNGHSLVMLEHIISQVIELTYEPRCKKGVNRIWTRADTNQPE